MKHLTEYQSFTQLLTQTMDKIMTLSSLFIPLAMILFMVTFIGFLYFAYSKRNKSFFEQMANLPLNSDEVQK